MTRTINNKIQRGFSASAKRYDLFSSLHRKIADKLFEQVLKENMPLRLLDVGCGTGYLTVKLKKHFSQSKMIGLDFSPEMLEEAARKHEDITWVLGDGNNLPFADGCIDILISNLAYQWSGDLSSAFTQARRVLTPGGVLVSTLFGFHTCQELFQSLDEATAKALQFSRLPSESRVREVLITCGFKYPKVDAEFLKIEFSSMYELISWLKLIGANNLSRKGYVGPEALSRAASIYHQKFQYFKGVGATFEVIKVYAKK